MDKFIVRYPTGGMMVYVGYFFSHANMSSVNKFLMLVTRYYMQRYGEVPEWLQA